MTSKHVRNLRNELTETPANSKNRLAALRALFVWAVEEDEVESNPVIGVKPIKWLAKGFHPWSEEEIAQYEKHHPIGTRPRLAMALMLFSACRREDVVRLGPQHFRDGWMTYIQAKNEHKAPVKLEIPVHPKLQEIIDATPTKHLTFLTTAYGKPFTVQGISGAMKDWCTQAGIPHCSSHGLRKASATRLAEAGCSPHQIMAITGHKSLKEVEVYTKAAGQKGLAKSAMARLK